MQQRSQTPGQQPGQGLKVLPRIFVISAAIIAAGIIPPARDGMPGDTAQLPPALRQWSQIDTQSLSEALKAFRRGVDHYDNERYASALEALPGDQDTKSIGIGDYVQLYRAKSNLMMKRNREALSDLRLLESRYPDSPLIRDAVMGQCQALLELNDPKSLLAVLDSYKAEANSETLYYRARALDQSGEKDQAVALYLQIYSRYPTSKHSPPAERHLLSLSPLALSGGRNYGIRLQRAENLLKANDARGARKVLLALVQVSAPDPADLQKRNLLLAEVEYSLNRTSAALSRLRAVTTADPAIRARAIYLEGACYRRLDREHSLLALRDKALELFPLSPDTEELCYSAATYFDVNYQHAKAQEAYRVLYKAFPKGRRAEIALWKLSLFSYFEKQYGEAAHGFWDYLLARPSALSASSAMYWMGRCYEKLGDSAKARYFYGRVQTLANNNYYGRRAREAETSLKESASGKGADVPGLDFKQVAAICDGIRLPPALLNEPDGAGARVVERARQLAAAGLPDLTLSELRWGIREYPGNTDTLYYIMARIHAGKEDYHGVISCLHRAFPDYSGRPVESLPEEVWKLLFPLRHWEIIATQAASAKIDPTLILGIIRQESSFNEKARSSANARGLMQILPSNGRRLARQARMSRYTVGKLYHAETNIILGTRYLAFLLRQYGKTELALAAYNAGETRVDRWLKEFGDLDMAEFVERIPFSETRNYVKQVLSNKAHYDLRTSPAATAARWE